MLKYEQIKTIEIYQGKQNLDLEEQKPSLNRNFKSEEEQQ